MIVLEIPGRPKLTLEHLVLDVNGTIALDGQLVSGVTGGYTTCARCSRSTF